MQILKYYLRNIIKVKLSYFCNNENDLFTINNQVIFRIIKKDVKGNLKFASPFLIYNALKKLNFSNKPK